jgi:hypothetical protein
MDGSHSIGDLQPLLPRRACLNVWKHDRRWKIRDYVMSGQGSDNTPEIYAKSEIVIVFRAAFVVTVCRALAWACCAKFRSSATAEAAYVRHRMFVVAVVVAAAAGACGCHFLHIFSELRKLTVYCHLCKAALQHCLTTLERKSDIVSTSDKHFIVVWSVEELYALIIIRKHSKRVCEENSSTGRPYSTVDCWRGLLDDVMFKSAAWIKFCFYEHFVLTALSTTSVAVLRSQMTSQCLKWVVRIVYGVKLLTVRIVNAAMKMTTVIAIVVVWTVGLRSTCSLVRLKIRRTSALLPWQQGAWIHQNSLFAKRPDRTTEETTYQPSIWSHRVGAWSTLAEMHFLRIKRWNKRYFLLFTSSCVINCR